MKIKFVKLNEKAVVPTKAHATDAGFDLTATSRHFDECGAVVYGTGIAMEIPAGYVGLVFPRSSLSKLDIAMANAVGVIDAGYRGEITCKFKPALLYCDNTNVRNGVGAHATDYIGTVQTDPEKQSVTFYGADGMFGDNAFAPRMYRDANGGRYQILNPRIYNVGERCAQLIIMPLPEIEFEQAEELEYGERGANGYGSSGK